MKRIIYPVLTVLVATACGAATSDANTTSSDSAATSTVEAVAALTQAPWRSLEPGTLLDDTRRRSGDTVGYVVGNFSGFGIDTLYCIALGCRSYAAPGQRTDDDPYQNLMDTYRFSNVKAGLPDLYVTDHPWLNFIKVGDLDGNGRDELQFLHNNATSNWLSYEAFDLFNNRWTLLTPPVAFNTQVRDDDASTRVYRSCGSSDEVAVSEDILNPETFEAETVEKRIPIDRRPVPKAYDICYTLPGGRPVTLP